MHIAYITHTRFPTERAHGLQIASVCDALRDIGHTVELIKPNVLQNIFIPAHEYYGLKHDLKERTLRHYNVYALKIIPYPLKFCFGMPVYRRALKRELATLKADALYIRSPGLLEATLTSNIPTILELHTLPRRNKKRFVDRCNRCKLVVCLTNPMKEELLSWGVRDDHVMVEGDAVDVEKMQTDANVLHLRSDHGIPQHVPIVGYAGQLRSMGMSKGVEELLRAAADLQRRGREFHMVIAGGPPDVQRELVESLSPDVGRHVTFLGALPHEAIPGLLAQCDVLTYSAPRSNHPFYVRDTSPLKLFEYMAARKPIVCADLPPLRDIVDEQTVRLFEPGNSEDLADAVMECVDRPDAAKKRAERAYDRVREHTWNRRMKRICDAIT